MDKLKCERCGNTDKFFVEATANVEVDGNGCVQDHDGFEWDSTAMCTCGECYYEGLYKDFHVYREGD